MLLVFVCVLFSLHTGLSSFVAYFNCHNRDDEKLFLLLLCAHTASSLQHIARLRKDERDNFSFFGFILLCSSFIFFDLLCSSLLFFELLYSSLIFFVLL